MNNLTFVIEKELQHQGMCDASGSVAIDEHQFLVADDEDNILKVYSSEKSGKHLQSIDTNSYFTNNPDKDEVDIEAVTQLKGILYWITSHGRNKNGKRKEERHQFFANEITNSNQPVLKQFGKSYTQLVLKNMLQESSLKKYNLEQAETIAPKGKGGLNIEGLTTTPEGELLIGFRNPITDGKALLLPLKNPLELVKQHENKVSASFGDPIEIDLEGLGIRSIEYWESYKVYLIIAGAYDSSDKFGLYWWSGNDEEKPQKIEINDLPEKFRPESILFYPNQKNRFQLLSDDGAIIRINNTPCKKIDDKAHPKKYFRSVWIQVS
jgi:hypothetical protein